MIKRAEEFCLELFNKMIEYFDRLALHKKLIISHILMITLPVTICSIYVFSSLRTGIINETEQETERLLSTTVSDIEKNIESCFTIANYLLNDKMLIKYFTEDSELSALDLIEFKNTQMQRVTAIPYVNPYIYRVRILHNSQSISDMWPYIYSVNNMKNITWFENYIASGGRTYARIYNATDAVPLLGNTMGQFVSLYLRRADSASKKEPFIVETIMHSDTFFKSVYIDSSPYISAMFITNKAGELSYEKQSSLYSTAVFNNDSIKSMLVKNTSDTTGSFTMTSSGTNFFVSYKYVETIDKYVYFLQSDRALIARLNKALVIILVISLAAIVALSLVSGRIVSIMTKRLNMVIHAMRKVRDGDLHTGIPVYSKDEIGELATHFKEMLSKVNDYIQVIVKKETAVRDAQINALYSQINNHFIYNVLDNIRMMVIANEFTVLDRTVTCLSELLRYSTSWQVHFVKLSDELRYIDNYLKLVNIQYDYKIGLILDIEPCLLNYECPKMLFQPIIENSVKHGIRPKFSDGRIVIEAKIQADRVCFRITDDGCGIDEHDLENLNLCINSLNGSNGKKPGHLGLANISERIAALYEITCGIKVYSSKGKYTTVEILLPYISN